MTKKLPSDRVFPDKDVIVVEDVKYKLTKISWAIMVEGVSREYLTYVEFMKVHPSTLEDVKYAVKNLLIAGYIKRHESIPQPKVQGVRSVKPHKAVTNTFVGDTIAKAYQIAKQSRTVVTMVAGQGQKAPEGCKPNRKVRVRKERIITPVEPKVPQSPKGKSKRFDAALDDVRLPRVQVIKDGHIRITNMRSASDRPRRIVNEVPIGSIPNSVFDLCRTMK